MLDLHDLGWDDGFAAAFEPHQAAGLVPGRVAVQHRIDYVVLTEEGELRADISGRLRHEGDVPAVGDWVALLPRDGARATVQAVLPRRTKFSRKAAFTESQEQVVAANVDTVLLVAGLGPDLNLRRLERYLALAWESGAQPAIVLTKVDLADDVPAAVADVETIAYGVPVHPLSGVTGEGVEQLEAYLRPGHTVALLGSSGVGKSTLVNLLAGREVLATQETRSDGRGRHTTSHRELVLLPGGGLVLDTPGMRELQLWEADEGLGEAFADVEELAARCRFNDCAHESEPGCAIRAAIASGALDAARFESYRKLERELDALRRKQDKRAQSEARKQWKARSKELRVDKF